MSAAASFVFTNVPSFFPSTNKPPRPNIFVPPNFCRPNFGYSPTPLRSKIFFSVRKETKSVALHLSSCLADDNSGEYDELGQSSSSDDSVPGATIDIKLPRRSLLVYFTCNSCGQRSSKLINRLAYERGTVFVQCSGCSQYHKLVDNLSLVVEYDLRKDTSAESNAEQA